MATENRLRATMESKYIELIDSLADERGESRLDAERAAVKEGLRSLGHLERPTAPHELYLFYINRIGLVLGFCGLIMIGYGIFGLRLWSYIGFGLTVMGFLLVALAEALPRIFEGHEE